MCRPLGWVENVIFWSVYFKTVLVEFSRPIRMKKACFSRTSVYKNFKNHFYPDPTRFPGPQTKYCPGKDLNHFRHGNLTPERGIKCRNKSTESTKSAFMSDIMAKTMVAGFKPWWAYQSFWWAYRKGHTLVGIPIVLGLEHISNSRHFLA